jgi:DNA-binding LytR/AlgR family response regulator
MLNIFKQSFPYNASWKYQLKTALGFGAFILIFLWVFEPFGLNTFPGNKLILACITYGVITFSCIFSTLIILPLFFPSFFREDNWTTGKQILHITGVIILVGLVNYLVSPFVVGTGYSLRNLLWFQGITLAVALLPVTFFTLLKQNSLLKKFQQQAADLEIKLQEKLHPGRKPELPASLPGKKNEFPVIELTGDYHGEKIVLPPGELYFIVAANNYVKVYFIKNEKISYSILRMTMKKVEEALAAWPGFFRCHRAYIVNLDKVQHVEGNAQGYKIRLAGVEEPIPVSRNLNSEFSDKLLALRST